MRRPRFLTGRFWRRFFWRRAFWSRDFWRRRRAAERAAARPRVLPWVDGGGLAFSSGSIRRPFGRTGRRASLIAVVAVAALLLAWMLRPAPKLGAAPVRIGSGGAGTAPEIGFPIAGPGRLTRSFGDPRPGGRSHAGVDIMAAKGVPVVAVMEGEVVWLRGRGGGECCSLGLRHAGGWGSRYLHLDNDRPGTDDGAGHGIAPGLALGSRVAAGDLIGWVGDSGNAEHTAPHLHFELRHPDGHAVDPFPALVRAALRDPRANAGVRLPAFPAGALAR